MQPTWFGIHQEIPGSKNTAVQTVTLTGCWDILPGTLATDVQNVRHNEVTGMTSLLKVDPIGEHEEYPLPCLVLLILSCVWQ